MPPSPGRSVSSHLVSRLRKALYGLKRANSGSKARLTADSQRGHRQKMLQKGFNDYILTKLRPGFEINL